MLNRVTGTVKQINQQQIIIDIGAVWLDLQVPRATEWLVNEQVQVITHLHWNQETGPALFGFATEFEKQLFVLITSCSGVGPKLGLAMLADLGARDCVLAIQQEDTKKLSSVTGIGQRKAEQIIVQLRHKLPHFAQEIIAHAGDNEQQWHTVAQTLESLRYSRLEVAKALSHLRTLPTSASLSFDQLVKNALSYLMRQT